MVTRLITLLSTALLLSACGATSTGYNSSSTPKVTNIQPESRLKIALNSATFSADAGNIDYANEQLAIASSMLKTDEDSFNYLLAQFHVHWQAKNYKKAIGTFDAAEKLTLTEAQQEQMATTLAAANIRLKEFKTAKSYMSQIKQDKERKIQLQQHISMKDQNIIVLHEGQKIERAKPIVRIEPKYPIQAARDGINGYVVLSYAVDENGRTTDIELVEASDPIFVGPAAKALSKWRYAPKKIDGTLAKETGMSVKLEFAVSAEPVMRSTSTLR